MISDQLHDLPINQNYPTPNTSDFTTKIPSTTLISLLKSLKSKLISFQKQNKIYFQTAKAIILIAIFIMATIFFIQRRIELQSCEGWGWKTNSPLSQQCISIEIGTKNSRIINLSELKDYPTIYFLNLLILFIPIYLLAIIQLLYQQYLKENKIKTNLISQPYDLS